MEGVIVGKRRDLIKTLSHEVETLATIFIECILSECSQDWRHEDVVTRGQMTPETGVNTGMGHIYPGGTVARSSQANQMPGSKSRDHTRPIRGQYPGHLISLAQSEASIQVM